MDDSLEGVLFGLEGVSEVAVVNFTANDVEANVLRTSNTSLVSIDSMRS